jgi:hypothetical protein
MEHLVALWIIPAPVTAYESLGSGSRCTLMRPVVPLVNGKPPVHHDVGSASVGERSAYVGITFGLLVI